MSSIDIIILIACVIAFILGYKDGFVRKLIGTVGFFLAVYLGITFSTFGGDAINKVMTVEPEFARVLGGFFIFVLTIIIAAVTKRLVHPFDKVNNLINRIAGGAVGTLQILIFISAVFYIMNIFSYPSKESRDKSSLYPFVRRILPKTIHTITNVSVRPAALYDRIQNDSTKEK